MQGIDQEFFIDTKIGKLLVGISKNKIGKISFNQPDFSLKGIKPKVVNNLENQLLEYFMGHRKTFQIDYNLIGTEFQKEVWQKLLDIPYGKTISYGKLAAQMGDVKKIRAVANAVGKNPVPIVIPCHRVVGVHGNLTGYIGGLANKKYLIELESNRQLGLF
ncbi:methylated-DNA--[protein]-cysteine S-methyltransferase [Marivirga harenae]|uniref:methylated-DNA--[protein]-cysteine S-methyltransferase n=1 Tax=Marivirga harenae TaxID=2010992 RepID=UPI0026DFF1B5|nr:methylated-DNA--[protein]-cysteine S-methyltransferase [Marivirga harenae]WKV13637.1 methylated-DNA--[protein]-cysteine S-methyltransferase [Marivirga harenae]|tara:strand:- start:5232 stop:5714 length:483 start_codon:yes stop_codon:yes gene_type:complete